jgi:hypothetical protein
MDARADVNTDAPPHAAPHAEAPPAPAAGVPTIEASMLGTVCPHGGFHTWEAVKGDNDFFAGIAAGACSTCLFCIWWPLLLWCVRGGVGGAARGGEMRDAVVGAGTGARASVCVCTCEAGRASDGARRGGVGVARGRGTARRARGRAQSGA